MQHLCHIANCALQLMLSGPVARRHDRFSLAVAAAARVVMHTRVQMWVKQNGMEWNGGSGKDRG
jgi:hypothetical protein